MSDTSSNAEVQHSGRTIRVICSAHHLVSPVNCSVQCSTDTDESAENSTTTVSSSTSFSQNYPATRNSATSMQVGSKTDVMSQTEPPSPPPTPRQVIIQRCQSAQVALDELDEPEPESIQLPVDEVRLFVQSQLREFLDQLPVKNLTCTDVEKSQQCSVCFEEYRWGERTMTLPCFHILHETCARRWFDGCFNCPLCRTCILNWD